MLAFDGETLNEAIAQVSQQTGWRFELEDSALGEMRVGGATFTPIRKRSSSFTPPASVSKRSA
ncbi:MAG: hypothetical protein DCF16_01895 [Alphaproteobacteria bacterium]|nr:MAG: hypothetical protein DCF16_01895 [Alphaproteobacteria bacterium]